MICGELRDPCRELNQIGTGRIGLDQLVRRRSEPIDPERRVPIPTRASRIPTTEGSECYLPAFESEAGLTERVGSWVRFVGARLIGADQALEQVAQARVLEQVFDHARREVREWRKPQAALAQAVQHLRRIRPRNELGERRRQSLALFVAQGTRVRTCRKAQRVIDQLREVGVSTASSAQPAVLEQARLPCRRERGRVSIIEQVGDTAIDAARIEDREQIESHGAYAEACHQRLTLERTQSWLSGRAGSQRGASHQLHEVSSRHQPTLSEQASAHNNELRMAVMHSRMGRDSLVRVDWDDLRFFLVVARTRTLSAAARELKVTQPTVGRRIAALERRLGAKLFLRRSDGFTLSKSGARALEHAEHMEQHVLATERHVTGHDVGIRGSVRVTASEWLVTSVLAPQLAPLLERHPELTVELLADQRHVNLTRREADLALRPRRFEHDAIVSRATAKLGFGLYAAPSYLHARGVPRFGDGRGHALIAMTEDTGDVARAWLTQILPSANIAARTNGRDGMLALAVAGAGLACLARVVGDHAPGLERLSSAPSAPTPTLWMGMHRDARDTPRVRAVATYVAERLRALRPRLCPAT